MLFHDRRLKVEVKHQRASYSPLEGSPMQLAHHSKTISITTEHAARYLIPKLAARETPSHQPSRRSPARRETAG